MIDIDALIKKLFEPGDFTLNPERIDEFVGCEVPLICPHADEPIDRMVWYNFVTVEGGGRSGMKLCVMCTKAAIAHPLYPPVACRVPKVIISTERLKDVIRSGRAVEAISELGKKLEQEVLHEAQEGGVN
jgi:hypothetical protein